MHIGQRCTGCKRLIRPKGERAEGIWVGTITAGGMGMCQSCRKGVLAGRGTTRYFKQPRPERCAGCNRRMRQRSKRADECPGTVMHRSDQLCETCFRARAQGRPFPEIPEEPEPALRQCRGCEMTTRPGHHLASQYPQVVSRRRNGHGFCCACERSGVQAAVLAEAEKTRQWIQRTIRSAA